MDTFQVTKFSFPCITIHETSLIHDPRRQNPSSTSKIVGFQYLFLLPILATNKIWPPYKFVRTENHNISNFILPPDTHPKNATAQENYETFSRSLRYYIVNCNTICSSKSPKSHVKLITYRNNDNGFDLLVSVVFTMSPQLGGLGPNA